MRCVSLVYIYIYINSQIKEIEKALVTHFYVCYKKKKRFIYIYMYVYVVKNRFPSGQNWDFSITEVTRIRVILRNNQRHPEEAVGNHIYISYMIYIWFSDLTLEKCFNTHFSFCYWETHPIHYKYLFPIPGRRKKKRKDIYIYNNIYTLFSFFWNSLPRLKFLFSLKCALYIYSAHWGGKKRNWKLPGWSCQ